MFEPVSSKVSFPKLEQRILEFWKQQHIFEKSIQSREGAPLFVLYEGPPTANASPGVHHVLSRVFKDVIPRYKTMKGFRAPRKAGWDTHGLPVELSIEKELGFSSKAQIEAYGIARFNERCRQSVFRYVKEWNDLTERIGYWVDIEHAYITLNNSYIESCWWLMRQLWEKGLVYQGYRVTPHCPRCGTSLSSHEVALGYEEADDPSVFIKFRVSPQSVKEHLVQFGARPDVPTYLLAWTTTPWTLPGNTALAVAPEADYAIVEVETEGRQEQLVLAEARLASSITHPYKLLGTCEGRELAGEPQHQHVRYEPLYRLPDGFYRKMGSTSSDGAATMVNKAPEKGEGFHPIAEDFVSMDEGTGIVHIAPAFGDVDYKAGGSNQLYFVRDYIDESGTMTGNPLFAGKFVKQADPLIIEDLKTRGLLYRSERIRHTYPFCWRCGTPLLYYAKPSWYIRTTAKKERLISANQELKWYPEHIKYGRFGDWLDNNVDWAVSRERYWGTPLPVWRCQGCGNEECIGSIDGLRKQADREAMAEAGNALDDCLKDLHRPFIDNIILKCPQCGRQMRRVPEVLDAWFDSGAMPVAQWHYPFENEEKFREFFPADYICEAVDQTRGWFYTLHALSVLLFDRPCYRNVICLGHILDAQGEKMSKSKGNVVEPRLILNNQGADALRWYLLTSAPPGNVRRFSAELVNEALKGFLLTLWNVYSFFITYANIDKFDPRTAGEVSGGSDLDRWITSELNLVIDEVTKALEGYDPTAAGRRMEGFVDDLSNWYVRRSRRRFWKSENDADKLAAYVTLHNCLVTLCKLLAPFTPFVAEAIYQNLVRPVQPDAPESVHLAEFPVADLAKVDEPLAAATRMAMTISSLGRAARSSAGVKVRQPLAEAKILTRSAGEWEALKGLADQIKEELNVKEIVPFTPDDLDYLKKHIILSDGLTGRFTNVGGDLAISVDVITTGKLGYAVLLDPNVTPDLADEGAARELVHRLQTMRRSAGFEIADYIVTYYQGGPTIQRVMSKHGPYIKQETLSRNLVEGVPSDGVYTERLRIAGEEAVLGVRRED